MWKVYTFSRDGSHSCEMTLSWYERGEGGGGGGGGGCRDHNLCIQGITGEIKSLYMFPIKCSLHVL